MNKCNLSHFNLLTVQSPQGGSHTGGSQMWFADAWKRTSGCGPTTASSMLWYLARSRQIDALCEVGNADKPCFLRLMDAVFACVTPRAIGVYSTKIFMRGVHRFGELRGVALKTRALNIPPLFWKRPKPEVMRDFILKALQQDLPLAFLNLSKGALTNLGGWHWVMLVALEPEAMTATICDHGITKEIDLGLWLKTSVLGGGLVSIDVQATHLADEFVSRF